MAELTYETIHEQVRLARELNERFPDGTQRVARGIRLGAAQVEAVQRHHRAASGLDDVGPVSEFAGLKVLSSRSADRLVVEYEGDPEDADTLASVDASVLPGLQEGAGE
jgi:hypothetical protein